MLWCRYVPWEQFEDLKSNMQHMAEQYQRYMSEQDAFLFGSDTDRRKEQYRQNMLNQFKEMMPQLVQIMSGGGGQQQQGMPGMPQQQQMSGFPAMPGMSMPGMQMPGQPMMQNPMQAMNGMAGVSPMAAAAAMQSMNGGMPPQMMNPMNGAGMMPGMGGMEAAQNMGRRARRRNGFALDDGFDEDYDDFRPRRGFSKRRGGGGGNWRDDDDMLGGLAGNGEYVVPFLEPWDYRSLMASQVCMVLEVLQEGLRDLLPFVLAAAATSVAVAWLSKTHISFALLMCLPDMVGVVVVILRLVHSMIHFLPMELALPERASHLRCGDPTITPPMLLRQLRCASSRT